MEQVSLSSRFRELRAADSIAAAALAAFGVIALAVTVIAVIESYSNLLAFALAYGLSGWRAAMAPGAVDSFIVMGELLLFLAAILRAWGRSVRYLGTGMAAWGFLLSTGGNIWHAASATVADRTVSAIWPVTATAGLAGCLIIVRRIMFSGAPAASPPGGGTGTDAPQPASPSCGEPPRRARPRHEAGKPAGQAAVPDDQVLLARLMIPGKPLPSARELARMEPAVGRVRAGRLISEARAAMNGDSHG